MLIIPIFLFSFKNSICSIFVCLLACLLFGYVFFAAIGLVMYRATFFLLSHRGEFLRLISNIFSFLYIFENTSSQRQDMCSQER